MPIKRVILHLGMSKAGSSSIQHTLFYNAPILKENGFRYLSEWGLTHHGKLRHLFSPDPVKHVDSTWGKSISKRKHQNDNKKLVDKMLKIINSSDCETLIISGECFLLFFSDISIQNLKTFMQDYFVSKNIAVSIVLMVRNPFLWTISILQQQIFRCTYTRNVDFFENGTIAYGAINNLQKAFPDSIMLIKFEDACLDENGPVASFLKTIDFPADEIKNLDIKKVNESRCIETVEFANYIESIEPRSYKFNFDSLNPKRTILDLKPIRHIKGVKYDLPYHGKLELWNRLQETLHSFKESTNIDYTNYKIPFPVKHETYSEQTIQEFVEAFPKLSPVIQKLFLKFFEKKYAKTAQEKFKQLYFKDSIPWRIYNNNSIFRSISYYRFRNTLIKLIPQTIKLSIKKK